MRILAYALLSVVLTACTRPASETIELQLESWRGQWLVINYWAQWCKPCIKEIPELNELHKNYPQVSVLGVNFDGASGAELAAQLEKLDVQFPTLGTDPAKLLGVPRPSVLPTTLIIDPEGKLSATLVGPQTLTSLAGATGQAIGAGH